MSLQILHPLLSALHFSYRQTQTHQPETQPTQNFPTLLLPLPPLPAPLILAGKHQGLSQQKWLWGVE